MPIERIFLLPFLLIASACADSDTGPNIPVRLVNLQINLNNIQYQSLRQSGGFVYVEGGHKGLIIFRKSETTYLAWDRICPHGPENACEIVDIDASGFFMNDKCCESIFDLNGYPTAGPARYPLVEYQATSDGTYLYVSN